MRLPEGKEDKGAGISYHAYQLLQGRAKGYITGTGVKFAEINETHIIIYYLFFYFLFCL